MAYGSKSIQCSIHGKPQPLDAQNFLSNDQAEVGQTEHTRFQSNERTEAGQRSDPTSSHSNEQAEAGRSEPDGF